MNGENAVVQNQCDQRMAGIRTEMDTGLLQVRGDLKELSLKIDILRSDVVQTAAEAARVVACDKIEALKAVAIEREKECAADAEEKLARSLKDVVLEHKIEILLVALLLLNGGTTLAEIIKGII